jgi:hypothetical protein
MSHVSCKLSNALILVAHYKIQVPENTHEFELRLLATRCCLWISYCSERGYNRVRDIRNKCVQEDCRDSDILALSAKLDD